MKLFLSALVTLVSVMAMADIPRPHVEPGQAKEIDSSAANVIVYGVPAAKLADLKAGSNTLQIQRQNMSPGVTNYVLTTRNCNMSIAGVMCLENKQLSVTQTVVSGGDRSVTTYSVGKVSKLR